MGVGIGEEGLRVFPLSFWGRILMRTPESDSGCVRRLTYQNDGKENADARFFVSFFILHPTSSCHSGDEF